MAGRDLGVEMGGGHKKLSDTSCYGAGIRGDRPGFGVRSRDLS